MTQTATRRMEGPMTTIVESLIEIFTAALKAALEANGTAEAEEEALMAAEAKLARLRAERKFR